MINNSAEYNRLGEISEINRQFLDLIALQAGGIKKNQYGLPAELCERIAGLSASERDSVSMVPLLLVTATDRDISDASAVHDQQERESRTFQRAEVAEQNFTATLLVWLTQDAQQNHSLASLWLGIPGFEREPVTELSFGRIQDLAFHAGSILHACFSDRLGLWNELIQAARSNNPRRQQKARLALLPHSCPSRVEARHGHWRKRNT